MGCSGMRLAAFWTSSSRSLHVFGWVVGRSVALIMVLLKPLGVVSAYSV